MQTSQELPSGKTTLPPAYGEIRRMIDNKRVGIRLEAIRKALGYKSGEAFAADLLGVDKSQYSLIKSGKRRLSLDSALMLRTLRRIPLDYVYFGDGLQQLPADIAEVLRRAA